MDERSKERMREALLRGDREAFQDILAAEQEHAPDNAYDFAMVAGYAVMQKVYGPDLDEPHLQAVMGGRAPTEVLAAAGLGPIESRPFPPLEQALRVASVYVDIYNDGLSEEKRLDVTELHES